MVRAAAQARDGARSMSFTEGPVENFKILIQDLGAGLSVFTFLKIRTYLMIENLMESQEVVEDSVCLARLEGLEGHARAAEKRIINPHKKQKI